MDRRNGNADIYGYNLATAEEFAICTNRAFQGWPVASGGIVVWTDERNSIIRNPDIYGARLSFEE
jgi:beta propeller repeat protein